MNKMQRRWRLMLWSLLLTLFLNFLSIVPAVRAESEAAIEPTAAVATDDARDSDDLRLSFEPIVQPARNEAEDEAENREEAVPPCEMEGEAEDRLKLNFEPEPVDPADDRLTEASEEATTPPEASGDDEAAATLEVTSDEVAESTSPATEDDGAATDEDTALSDEQTQTAQAKSDARTWAQNARVTGLRAAILQSGALVRVSWDKVQGADGYAVYRQALGQYGLSYLGATVQNTYSDRNFSQAGLHFYWILPYRYQNQAQKKAPVFASISQGYAWGSARPLPLGQIVLKRQGDAHQLSWPASPKVTGYLVEKRDPMHPDYVTIATVREPYYVDPDPYTDFTIYRIRGVFQYRSIKQQGPTSEIRSDTSTNFRTPNVQKPALTVQNSGRWGARLQWNAIPGAERYSIYTRRPDTSEFTYLFDSFENETECTLFELYPGRHDFYIIPQIRTRDQGLQWGYASNIVSVAIQPPQATYECFDDWSDYDQLLRAAIKVHAPRVRMSFRQPWSDVSRMEDYISDYIYSFLITGDDSVADWSLYTLPDYAEFNAYEYDTTISNDAWTGQALINVDLRLDYHSASPQYDAVKRCVTQLGDQFVKQSKNPFKRAKAGFDWLINTIDYAYEADGTTAADVLPSGVSSHSAYGVLSDRLAVCQGYSSFLSALYEWIGIPTFHAISPVDDHWWIMAEIQGDWYHLDPTHADETAEGFGINYDFFLRSDDEISQFPLHTLYDYFPLANFDADVAQWQTTRAAAR